MPRAPASHAKRMLTVTELNSAKLEEVDHIANLRLDAFTDGCVEDFSFVFFLRLPLSPVAVSSGIGGAADTSSVDCPYRASRSRRFCSASRVPEPLQVAPVLDPKTNKGLH